MNNRAILALVGLISAICWVQLTRLINTTTPTPNNLVLASILAFFALGGTGALISWVILYRRNWPNAVPTALRQGCWIGMGVVVLAWLQLVQALTTLIGIVLLAIFVTAESLFLLRDIGPKERRG